MKLDGWLERKKEERVVRKGEGIKEYAQKIGSLNWHPTSSLRFQSS